MAAPAAGPADAELSSLSYTSLRSPFIVAELICEAIVIVWPSSEENVSLSVSTPPLRFTVSKNTTALPSQEHCIFVSLIPPICTRGSSGASVTSVPSTVQERRLFCVPRALTVVNCCLKSLPLTVTVSVSLVGGGNWPKLLLEGLSFQVPFNFESCARLGSANAARAIVIARNFRC